MKSDDAKPRAVGERVERLLTLATQIQQIPAPTFDEGPRAEFVQTLFVKDGLQDTSRDALHNVFGRLPGKSPGIPLVVSAHLDTVFQAGTDLSCRREEARLYGPGIGDNSLGVAALLGLIGSLREGGITLPTDIWFVANVCEEGLGNLRGMTAVVDRFGADVKAYLVIEGTALGHVYHRAIAVQRYRIVVKTAGGHSWSDYGQPSAIHELARIVTQMTGTQLPISPRTSLNVGLISGGTGVNVLAPEARLELDVRSESTEAMNAIVHRVEDIVRSVEREGVLTTMEIIGQRPAGSIDQDHPLLRLAQQCITDLGLKASFTSGSTDANIPLSRGYPALVLGVTTGGSAHTVHEYIDIEPIEKGMQQLERFVQQACAGPQ